jgi:hypothetical protein
MKCTCKEREAELRRQLAIANAKIAILTEGMKNAIEEMERANEKAAVTTK